MLVANRIEESVKGNRPRLGVVINVTSDPLRPKPEPAGIFSGRRGRVEVVPGIAPAVKGNRIGNRVVEYMTRDAVAD